MDEKNNICPKCDSSEVKWKCDQCRFHFCVDHILDNANVVLTKSSC